MPSVSSGLLNIPKRSYISTAPLSADGDHHVYSYTRSYNSATYTWSGALTGIDFTAAPYNTYNLAGVVFRETGKKLYANANPGVDRYMVGVYIDGTSELAQMFIDPNCSVFADFNGDRPNYIPTNTDDHESGLDLGHPVYTYGNVTTTAGNIVASSMAAGEGSLLLGAGALGAGVNNAIAVGTTATSDNQIITAGAVSAGTTILSSGPLSGVGYSAGAGGIVTQTGLITNSVTINKICGQIQTIDPLVNIGANSTVTFTVNNSTVTQYDNVILTVKTHPDPRLSVFVSAVVDGSFNITILNANNFNIDPLAFTINFAVLKSVIA